ncbi:RNA-binding protein 48 isoform X2 [Sorex fumeus]|uniref:RNA-binding protein 48 isoform X2 n=1 Tax=Sorex fumeus TaxID=62283 RepID=UPI0024AD66FD|nr:RNA-binding protein 48 isoform X2 [Sorex fumeus]
MNIQQKNLQKFILLSLCVCKVQEPKDTRDSTQDFQKAESSGFSVDTSKNPGNSDPCLPYSCELPLCYFSSQCKCSSMEHVNRAPESSQDGGRYNRTAGHCNHSGSLHRKQTKNSSVACPRSQAAASPSEAVDRFMPRTTQLQERKRRREDDRKRGAFPETSTSSNDVMIGPRLPDIPKVDLHDDSLNTTANIIRNKLKEVISAVPKSPGDSLEDVRISHPLKQRRRI